MKFRPLALLAVLLMFAPAAAQAERQWFEGDPTPLRYEISVTPDADAGTFTGETRISIESAETLSSVTMNALELTVSRATIDGASARVSMDETAQTLTLTPRRPLRPGAHAIRIVYAGKIYDDAYGLFRVSYQADGQTRRALTTQFEPGDARRFAPMWDQPNRRAVFSLTVTAPSDQMVVGNMPAAETTRLPGNRTRTRFADTPSMPSYLLYMAVGDFERVSMDVDGIDLGVVVRRGQGERARYALEAGAQSLRYFANYFGSPYPLPKLDMIGVPGAGGFAAMENWGAILYFDQFILLDDHQSSEGERQFVFEVVAHEIAHQWFGNLVTMGWWDDLWLNEGFASWMAAKTIEHVHPDWNPWLSQITNGTATAMALDSRVGTHPVVQRVDTIEEASLAFDDITYEKGLAVIRMIEAYVGEDDFRAGVRAYLNAHLYGNARTEELWSAIQAASGQPVLEIARSFTGQVGFPMLDVAGAACTRGAGNPAITVTQRRFAMDDASRTGERWTIPVVARRLGGEPVQTVLPAQETGSLDVPPCGAYVVNSGQSGFFRVRYDRANLAQLTARMSTLPAADQLGLLLDYYAFGRSGDAPFSDYLNLADALGASTDPLVAMTAAGGLQAIAGYATGRPSEDAVRAYARNKLRPFFDRLGWTPRPEELGNDTLARAQLIATLGALGDEDIIAEARRRVLASDTDPSALPGSARTAIFGVYAANATPEDYEALLARARNATDFVEQRRMWLLAASASDPALAQRSLELTLGEDIPRQMRTQIVSRVATAQPRLAWDFLVAHRDTLEGFLDPLQRLEFPGSVASASSDPAVADELETYTRDFPEGARPSVASAVASIRLRARTISEDMPVVEAWVARRSGGSSASRAGGRR
ncbi:MAG: M1 family metallopeptidase [Hyphomonadaceae bacterium]